MFFSIRLYLAPPSHVTSDCKNQDGDSHKPRWRRPRCRTRGFRTAVHKPMGDITVTTSTSYIQSMGSTCVTSTRKFPDPAGNWTSPPVSDHQHWGTDTGFAPLADFELTVKWESASRSRRPLLSNTSRFLTIHRRLWHNVNTVTSSQSVDNFS